VDDAEFEALLAALTKNEIKALRRFFATRLPRGSLADDGVQETLIRAFEKRAALASGSRLLPWLYGLAENVARELRRKQARVWRISLFAGMRFGKGELDEVGTEPDPAEDVADAERRERIQTAIDQLPPDEAQVLRLCLNDGLTQVEVAARLGWPASRLKNLMRSAREKLLELLPDEKDL
jgi:RNA polymerase sigma-70 factor (ECF subfamily)